MKHLPHTRRPTQPFTIPFDRAMELLEHCAAVIVDDDWLIYPSVFGLNAEIYDDDVITMCGDYNNMTRELIFYRKSNQNVLVEKNRLVLRTSSGKTYEIAPLQHSPIAP